MQDYKIVFCQEKNQRDRKIPVSVCSQQLRCYSQEAHVRAPHTQTGERQSARSYSGMSSLTGTATPDE